METDKASAGDSRYSRSNYITDNSYEQTVKKGSNPINIISGLKKMGVKRLIGFLEKKISSSKLNKITLISALLEATFYL